MSARIGSIMLCLIQPEGECIHSEFLDNKGEGLHHLGFFVDDLDKEVAKLAKQGLIPIQEASTIKGSMCAHFEPEGVGGIILELVQRPAQEINIKKISEGKSPFSQMDTVGVVVKDVDKVIRHLSSLGIGPFEPYKYPGPVTKRKLHGQLVEATIKIMVTKIGQIELQLEQPEEGECLQKEILDKRGEGFLHLGFHVDNIDLEVAKLAKLGLTPAMEGSTAKGRFFAFFKPEGAGGIILELVKRLA
jgi:4-hydroxyphenylpyruvate dioxygenase-like putative hemolysin